MNAEVKAKIEQLKNLKLPPEMEGKKLVMTPQMFVDEINILMSTAIAIWETTPGFLALNEEGRKLIINEFAIGYVKDIYNKNIENKEGKVM